MTPHISKELRDWVEFQMAVLQTLTDSDMASRYQRIQLYQDLLERADTLERRDADQEFEYYCKEFGKKGVKNG